MRIILVISFIFFLPFFLRGEKAEENLKYLSKKNAVKVEKFLRGYNYYWKVADTPTKTRLKLFDAFDLEGQVFRMQSLIGKKIVIIIFSDDLNLNLAFFWIDKESQFMLENNNLFSVVVILEPTLPYYSIYRKKYEEALKKHLRRIEEILKKKKGKRLVKKFLQKIPNYWIFDYRMELARAYQVLKIDGLHAKNKVLIYSREGELKGEFTGKEKTFPGAVFDILKRLMKSYGYYLYSE